MPPVVHIPSQPRANNRFESHVRSAVQTVRSAIEQMLNSVGADIAQPRSIAKQFGLDKTLAWKLAKIVGEDNPAVLVDHMPGRAGFEIAMRTLEDAGASTDSIAALRSAIVEFDRMVEVHCGDRETLELMLGYMHKDSEPEREEAHRKRAFQGNRAIWGVQARVQICSHFVAPNVDDPSMLDIATVSGLVDLRRLRSETVWPIASFRNFSDDGTPMPLGMQEPIDRHAMELDGLPVLRDFSTDPLPPIRSDNVIKNMQMFELAEGPVGIAAAVTCLTGIIIRARFGRYRDEHNHLGEHIVTLSTPVECLLHQLHMHVSLEHMFEPAQAIHSQLPNEPLYPAGGRDRGRLRYAEKIMDLGSATDDLVTPEFPKYRALMEMVIHRLGWTPRDFRGVRFRMRYPPMASRAMFRYELPSKP